MNIVLSTGTHLLFGKLYLRQIYKNSCIKY